MVGEGISTIFILRYLYVLLLQGLINMSDSDDTTIKRKSDFNSASTADAPDLDWSQVRETVFMLNLAVGQILASLKDGNESIGSLSDNFINMAGELTEVELLAGRISLDADEHINTESKKQIIKHCKSVNSEVQKSIVTFQFYDRLCQRLERVSDGLTGVAGIIGDPSKLYNPFEWNKLHQQIHTSYGTKEERQMLDLIKKGHSVHEAIEKVESNQPDSNEETVELF